MPQQPACAPLNQTFLPMELKKMGYATHIIGKWHLGFCKWECTPTYRGFDSFYGYYNANEDYYNYEVDKGSDFRVDKKAEKPNVYSTYAYSKRADEVIGSHNKSQPLFLYLPFQSVHEPIEVPQIYENMYSHIKNKGRRQFSGMVTALDDAIGNVTHSLMKYGLYNETLIIFTADNGGWTAFSGNNYPLRGGKLTVYEGGTRAVQFVHGAGISKSNYTFNGIMHAVDWMPTILAAAGGGSVPGIDGINHWPDLQDGIPRQTRTEFIYNLDDSTVPVNGKAAIRVGDHKLIEGFAGPYNGWYPPAKYHDDSTFKEHDPKSFVTESFQLYDLIHDPNEHNNLYGKEKDVFTKLKARLDEYKKSIVPALNPANDPASNPLNYGGYWTPGWC
ncbi:ARSB [Mytilus coruscus]|uniref:ARSB n=1 Tax=Mytilus coruscus TaxID=42192 RepID=A0A6J8B8A2_MYTCO|nr:ARSB [Mytilus coruscus]